MKKRRIIIVALAVLVALSSVLAVPAFAAEYVPPNPGWVSGDAEHGTLYKFTYEYNLNALAFTAVSTTSSIVQAHNWIPSKEAPYSLKSLKSGLATRKLASMEDNLDILCWFQTADTTGLTYSVNTLSGSNAVDGISLGKDFTYNQTLYSNVDLTGMYLVVVLALTSGSGLSDICQLAAFIPLETSETYEGLTSVWIMDFSQFDEEVYDPIYNKGHSDGYSAGIVEGRSDVDAVKTLLPGVFGGVASFFADTLGGMSLFGISVLDVFLTFVMIALVSFVIRFVK